MKSGLSTFVLIIILGTWSPSIQAATNTFHVTGGNGQDYIIDGVNDPTTLTLVRGFTYFFDVNVSAVHPFFLRTTGGTNLDEGNGVTNNGATSTTIIFDVALDYPDDELKYQCGVHAGMTGPLHIMDPPSVLITDFSVGADVEIKSTGYDEDLLNLNVLMSTDLLTNLWTSVPIQSNEHADGTNTTTIALPAGDAVFFQVQQGFFD